MKHEKHKMNDNRMVKENHEKGIARVKMRAGDLKKGQGGKMGMHHESDGFKRPDNAMTPRKA